MSRPVFREEGAVQPAAIKPAITLAQFEGVDVRAGTIASVYDVPNSKKLVGSLLQ
jgi:tRNA-binding EMAP/Myf-like protein